MLGFSGALPILLKGTEDDGITTGDIVSVLDGKSHHYRIPINPAVSVKQMVLDGKPGISKIQTLPHDSQKRVKLR